MIELETPYHVVETDGSGHILIMRRTPRDYPDTWMMEQDLEAVIATLDEIGRDRKKLLVDLREGPRRNDPQFEDTMRRFRPRLFRGFRGAAIIVKTAVGALQVKRHLREDGAGAEVFHDEAEALEYLRGQSVRGEAPPVSLAPRRPQALESHRSDRISSLPTGSLLRASQEPPRRPSEVGDPPRRPSEVGDPPRRLSEVGEPPRTDRPSSAPAPATRPSRH
ncbi:hypothetical protein [Polyangium sorediatum]|uniref:STAS/SEC14 domain-containing protein n=1 Tax=Polyangium sorediatum TaxID=889274 RepID=A0ABT6NVD4_9BACT|nr:hypothetical protein [Polyangium sorediatum]MDI1432288.1 hypothetical protein [Polyangium sorediatum]